MKSLIIIFYAAIFGQLSYAGFFDPTFQYMDIRGNYTVSGDFFIDVPTVPVTSFPTTLIMDDADHVIYWTETFDTFWVFDNGTYAILSGEPFGCVYNSNITYDVQIGIWNSLRQYGSTINPFGGLSNVYMGHAETALTCNLGNIWYFEQTIGFFPHIVSSLVTFYDGDVGYLTERWNFYTFSTSVDKNLFQLPSACLTNPGDWCPYFNAKSRTPCYGTIGSCIDQNQCTCDF